MTSLNEVRAESSDGRAFMLSGPGTRLVAAGDVVVLTPEGAPSWLGQVTRAVRDHEPGARGVLVGPVDPADGARPARFEGAPVAPATATELAALQEHAGAELPVGTWTSGGVDVPARLRAQGFSRHTFLCGQSGSGKTYALGVLLEQLLLGTSLRMVVLDPNADFVHLGEPRADAPTEAATAVTALAPRVLGARSTGAEPLRMRFTTLPVAAQAALLRLDPLADRAEYNLFLHRVSHMNSPDVETVVADLRAGDVDERALAMRIENLGLLDWEVWAGELPSAAEIVASGPRVTVMDLSGFRDPHEPPAVALDVIEHLWAERESRTPTLLVIDEAHNLCPAQPRGSLHSAIVDRLVQIAAEGRKYGLWLLLSTQRPSKIHPQVLSQCDNLMLMRMNSPGDLAELAELFGFAPPDLLAASPDFGQGEAVLAGSFAPRPMVVRVGRRLTVEGGVDVRVPAAR